VRPNSSRSPSESSARPPLLLDILRCSQLDAPPPGRKVRGGYHRRQWEESHRRGQLRLLLLCWPVEREQRSSATSAPRVAATSARRSLPGDKLEGKSELSNFFQPRVGRCLALLALPPPPETEGAPRAAEGPPGHVAASAPGRAETGDGAGEGGGRPAAPRLGSSAGAGGETGEGEAGEVRPAGDGEEGRRRSSPRCRHDAVEAPPLLLLRAPPLLPASSPSLARPCSRKPAGSEGGRRTPALLADADARRERGEDGRRRGGWAPGGADKVGGEGEKMKGRGRRERE
jgi:hypothetical protein